MRREFSAGGVLIRRESPVETALREVAEETGAHGRSPTCVGCRSRTPRLLAYGGERELARKALARLGEDV